MIALIDGDIVVWRCGFAAQDKVWDIYDKQDDTIVEDTFTKAMADMYVLGDEDRFEARERTVVQPWPIAKKFCDNVIQNIMEGTSADEYKIFLGGKYNFRKKIDPSYKANRKGLPHPEYKEQLRGYLVLCHGAKVVEYIEADDAIAIEANKLGYNNCVIASIDKDMRQLGFEIYNFVTRERSTWLDADMRLWEQMLTGDIADNVQGIKGIGPKKAAKIIGINPPDYRSNVWSKYIETYGEGKGDKLFFKNLKLLRMLRTQEEADEVRKKYFPKGEEEEP